MWPISTRFAKALTDGHTVVTKLEVLGDDNDVIADLTDRGVIVEGSVSVSRSEVQRSGSVTLLDRDGTLTPRDVQDLFAPAGNQIRLWRGIQYPERLPGGSFDSEYVPIATLRYTKVDTDGPTISLGECFDRSWIVQGAKIENTLNTQTGLNVIDAVTSLLVTAYPNLTYNFPSTDEVCNNMSWDAESDPWSIAQGLAANLGLRLFFDPMGTAVMRPEATQDDPIVWDYDDSSDAVLKNNALPGVQLSWDGTGNNAVIVVAENTDLPAPIRSVAYDTNPKSPTQYGGKFGRRPIFIRDETISSQAQADARALKELRSVVGLLQSISIPTIVNPAFEINDVVRISLTRADLSTTPFIEERFCILDGFEIPLRAKGNQTLQTRAMQIVQND